MAARRADGGGADIREPPGSDRWGLSWVTFFDYTDWATGATGSVTVRTRVGLREIYERVSSAQSRVLGIGIGNLFALLLGVFAVLFLIIEVVAFIMGFALARSITGAATGGTGVGLANTRARLTALHGPSAELAFLANEPTGVIAVIDMPLLSVEASTEVNA